MNIIEKGKINAFLDFACIGLEIELIHVDNEEYLGPLKLNKFNYIHNIDQSIENQVDDIEGFKVWLANILNSNKKDNKIYCKSCSMLTDVLKKEMVFDLEIYTSGK